MSTKYPIPSHVSVQSFVTVKLSDKSMHRLWKTQMLRLLESHDMLGFINESTPLMQDGDEHKLWNQTDALVQGWILGSLSEQAAITVLNSLESKLQQTHFTAKHIWDQVQSLYGQQAAEREDQRKGGVCGSLCIDLKKKVKEKREISRYKQVLYDAIACGKLQQVVSILKEEKVGITESISINGNTALHIAVSYRDGWVMKSILDLTDIPLTEVQNSDGSTPLHLAASLGNADIAKILLDRCSNLLHVKDNQGCTPLNIILSRPLNKEMCLFLMNCAMPDIEHADVEPLLVNAVSYRHFDLALTFIQRCNSLNTPAVLMAIAQNCPADFTPIQLLISEMLQTPILHFITRGTSDMKGCMKLANLALKAVLAYPCKMLIRICIKLQVCKDFKERMKERGDARDLLDAVCALIRCSNEAWCYRDFYTEAMLEAIRRDASDVVEIILYWFPEAALILDEDGHNFAQAIWKNRASKTYALILDGNLAKHTSLSQESSNKDNHCGNNFLHFAARLGPPKNLYLIPGPNYRMQHELQWFKVAQDIIPYSQHIEENCMGETPEMVFTKEHKDLEIESRTRIKLIAKSGIITATLLVTFMFTGAIQVPGGTDEQGLPNLISNPAFVLFETSIFIAMLTASVSLYLFLVALASPITQEDFLLRLPLIMLIGGLCLFMTQVLTMLAFGAGFYLLFGSKEPWIHALVDSIIAIPMSFLILLPCWFALNILTDFIHCTFQFWIIRAFRRLKLVGRIFI